MRKEKEKEIEKNEKKVRTPFDTCCRPCKAVTPPTLVLAYIKCNSVSREAQPA